MTGLKWSIVIDAQLPVIVFTMKMHFNFHDWGDYSFPDNGHALMATTNNESHISTSIERDFHINTKIRATI
ncbi:MAG: hypothetical protein HQK62_11780 [Desulfamplus sp.]|nr:hypothetical protein [Desulfamplus sp.]